MPAQEDCIWGRKCTARGCTYRHPGDCRFGGKCTSRDCTYRHPGEHRTASEFASSQCVVAQSKQLAVAKSRPATAPVKIVMSAESGRQKECLQVTVNDPVRMMFLASVDNSYSMDDKKATAMEGLHAIYSCIRDGDRLAIDTFADDVQRIVRMTNKRGVTWPEIEAAVRAAKKGCTALYDSIEAGIQLLAANAKSKQAKRPLIVEHLVITDGLNNSGKLRSAEDFVQLCALVKNPGISSYNLSVIAVGADDDIDEPKLKQLCKPRHARYYRAHDISGLRDALEKVTAEIRIKLCAEDSSGRVSKASWSGSKRDAPAALQDMAPMMPMLCGASRGLLTDGASARRAIGGPCALGPVPSMGSPRPGGKAQACKFKNQCTNVNCKFQPYLAHGASRRGTVTGL